MLLSSKLENPRTGASFISVLFFWWLHPFLRLGYKKGLQVTDLYDVLPSDSSEELAADLLCEWNRECIVSKETGKSDPSLLKALWRTFKPELLLSGALVFVKECLIRTGQSLILGRLLRSFSDSSETSNWMFIYASALVASSTVSTLVEHTQVFRVRHLAMRVRLAVNSVLYQKSLRLSQQSQSDITIWQVINLLANDGNRFETMLEKLHFLWIAPIQILIVLPILLWTLGPSSLIGTGITLLFVPLQSCMGKIFSSLRIRAARCTDDRISKMSEILSGIRIIKMYAWEKPFVELVRMCRKDEMSAIRKSAYLAAFSLSLSQLMTKLTLFPTFLVEILTGGSLTAEKTFVTVALLNTVGVVLGDEFPEAMRYFMEGRELTIVFFPQNYLLLEEKTPPVVMRRPHINHCGVWLHKVSVRWPVPSESDRDTLSHISLSVKTGQMVAIVGPIGAGKVLSLSSHRSADNDKCDAFSQSSLLQHILGELPAASGSSKIIGRVAYSPQEPWLFGGTVRQNILCGRFYDPARYKRVVEACALHKDFDQMPRGDLTPVGERGSSLSGGQRARIGLARALYVDADIYVIDDPLSAVDPRVGNHLFQKCVVELLRHKIRIVVTHQVQHLRRADQIVILKEVEHLSRTQHVSVDSFAVIQGRIEATGPYEELKERLIDCNVTIMEEAGSQVQPTPETIELPSAAVGMSDVETLHAARRGSRSAISLRNRRVSTVAQISTSEIMDDMDLYDDESAVSGAVSSAVYWNYLRSGSGVLALGCFVVSCLITELLLVGSDYWITFWTEVEESKCTESVNNSSVSSSTTKPSVDLDTMTAVYIYSGLTCALLVFMFLRNIHFFHTCTEASVHLHNRMLNSVTFTPISFFENNPIGSILNRFSKDLSCVDETLPESFGQVISFFLSILSALVLICSTVSPWFILPLIFVVGPFFYLKHFFLKTARSLRRLEAATRSPIYSHVCSTLIGLTTLRAHQSEKAFQKMFDDKQDLHSASWYMFIAASGWFATWLDWICNVYVACVTFTCVALRGTMSGSEVGLAISSTIVMANIFEWVVRESAALEGHMISVERVIEYSQLPAENEPNGNEMDDTWPVGDIVFDQVSLCYAEDRLVLKNISFHIKANEKIGIVGRSGAGKSSIVASLFRLAEHEGHVYIDGVDTRSIDVHRLRSSLYIIPQDPVLFSGTLRSNLDRSDEYTDEALWSALDAVNLKDSISCNPAGLKTLVTEGGSNMSVGERQLICLARAILLQNRVIVLDEATANVDLKYQQEVHSLCVVDLVTNGVPFHRTDALIQQTIRDQFKDCTVLTIAHRLNTVMDSDRIMILDDGYLKEFDEPAVLLGDPESVLHNMVNQTGETNSKRLIAMAQHAHDERHKVHSAAFTAPQ
nr:ABCC4-1 protein [Diaphanosoma celebensis]